MNKKNNDALWATYPDYANDLERLKAYNAEHSNNALTGEKARYHNKYQGQPEDYQKHIATYGENYKYAIPANKQGFHSEFIINDKTNNLVSQWNAYEFDANGHVISDPNKTYTQAQQLELVDGNSVNYAESAEGSYHTKMDSNPVSKYDPEVRKKIGKEWNAPVTGTDHVNDSDYFDTDKSKKDADEKLEEK